jgi:transcriptional regulator with XRE-family HTH domain
MKSSPARKRVFGSWLREVREKKGWSQQELANQFEATGATQSKVSRWESGDEFPNHSNRREICRIFGLSLEELDALLQEREIQQETKEEAEVIPAPVEEKETQMVLDHRGNVQHQAARGAVLLWGWRKDNTSLFTVGGGFILFLLIGLLVVPRVLPPEKTVVPSFSRKEIGQSTVRQESQGCALQDNQAGYLKVYSYDKKGGPDKVICFSGTGDLNYKIDNVKKVETGRYRAGWSYIKLDRNLHHSPTRLDEHVFWCSDQKRVYGYNDFVQITKIVLASATTECMESNQ